MAGGAGVDGGAERTAPGRRRGLRRRLRPDAGRAARRRRDRRLGAAATPTTTCERRWLGTLPEPGSAAVWRGGPRTSGAVRRRCSEPRSASGRREEAATLVQAPAGAAWRRIVAIPVGDDVVAVHDLRHQRRDRPRGARRRAVRARVGRRRHHRRRRSAHLGVAVGRADRSATRPTDLVGRPAAELIHPDDVDATMRRFDEVIADPGSIGQPLEVRILDADGEPRWFECVGVNKLDDPLLGRPRREPPRHPRAQARARRRSGPRRRGRAASSRPRATASSPSTRTA